MNKKLYKALYYLVIITIFILILLLIKLMKLLDICCTLLNIITPIFFGYVLAWILNPLYKKLNKRMNNKLSFLLILLSFVLFYTLIILIITPIIINESGNFINMIKSYIPKLKNVPFIKFDESTLQIKFDKVIESCGGVLSIIINFALINMFGFYILYNYSLISSLTKKLLPNKYKDLILKFIRKLSTNMYEFVRGTLLDTLVMFIMTFILFLIFGFKYSILIALFIALTNIIPFIGPYIGGVPAVLIGFSMSIKMGIIGILIVVISQLIESNLINPIIMSKVTKINPLLIVIAITIIGKLFGVVMMALTIPILIFIKISYEFIIKHKNEIIKMSS